MKTSQRLLLATLSLLLAPATPAFAAESAATPTSKPNIIVIVADDLGYGDLGFQGGKDVPTPHIDSLAKNGVRFTDGYVTGVVCSPTRAGLVTGRYQQRFGHEFNPGGVDQTAGTLVGLPLSESTIADALKKVGYKTALVGKWHLGSHEKLRPQQRGFDEFYGFLGGAHPYVPNDKNTAGGGPIFRGNEEIDAPAHLTAAFGQEAAAFIERQKKGTPFYLQLTFNAVHNPLQPDAEHLARFEKISDPKRRAYAGLLSGLDDAVGDVLKALQESGQEENTLVFFISDNGGPQQGNGSNNAPLTGDKATVLEGGIRVPFVLQWKGKVPAGSVYKQPVISLDIPATAAELAGATLGSPERTIDGVNIVPYVLGENQAAPHKSLYWRAGPQHAIRQGNYKLRQQANQPPKLFDVVADVAEQQDLASAKPEVVKELAAAYDEWDKQLAKPLWKGGPRKGRQQNAAQRAARAERRAKAAPTVTPAPAANPS
jgi:arylsulfatase A-like enzyme